MDSLQQNNVGKLRDSVSRLLSRCKQQQELTTKLQAKLEQQGQTIEQQNLKIEELEQRVVQVLLSQSLSEISGGNKTAKARINAMIKDIDRCLAIINR